MKHLLSTLFAFALSASLFAQDLVLQQAYQAGSTGIDGIRDFVLDSAGNKYIVGYFSGTVDFDPSATTSSLSVAAGQTEPDGFIVKLTPQNQVAWAVRIGGTDNGLQDVKKVKIDLAGDLVVSGESKGQITLPGGTTYAGSLTDYTAFMVKLDTATGAVWWSNFWGGASSFLSIRDFEIDNLNNILIVGQFSGSIDLNPGASTLMASSNNATYDIFMVKLDYLGLLLNAEYGGGNGWDFCQNITIVGNFCFMMGSFENTVDFDFGSGYHALTSAGSRDVFILQTDLNFNYINALRFGGNDLLQNYYLTNINNSLYAYGRYSGSVDLDPDPVDVFTVTNSSNNSFYLLKLDLNLDLKWARTWSYVAGYPRAFFVDNDENVHMGGLFFVNTFDADPSPSGVFNLLKNTGGSSFYIQLDSSGTFTRAFSLNINAPNNFSVTGISEIYVDQSNRLILGGDFQNSLVISPSPIASSTIYSNGQYDAMLLTLTHCSDTVVPLSATACGTYTLPSGQNVTQSGTYTDTLVSQLGCDSLVQTNVTINPIPTTSIAWQGDTAVVVANPNSSYTYQWYDCNFNQPIAGATKHYYKPTANGRWRVAVADGTCISESNCYQLNNFGLVEKNVLPNVELYPNPTNGLLTIQSSTPWQKVEVLDMLGRHLQTYPIHQPEINLAHMPSGVYLLKVYFAEGVVVKRVVRE